MGAFEVGYAGAALAGLLSFLSPCVLPLVPPYLCFLAGVGMQQMADRQGVDTAMQRHMLVVAFAFVLGFATVFVALGATASATGRLLSEHMTLLSKIAGVLIIIVGLHFVGVVRIGALLRDLRFNHVARPAGFAGAYLVGLAFAFGWSPCVGPVLATILFIAAGEESVSRGATLLLAYALGIGVPFLAAALLAGPFLRLVQRFRRYLHVIEQVTGGLLIVTGLLFISGSMTSIGFWLLEMFPALGRVG